MEGARGGVVKLVALGVALRLALAPFFMHTWDVTTVLVSTDQFLRGLSPYEYVMEQSRRLLEATGVPIPYYGYAYLPTPLLVYAPFYAAYLALFGPGEPLVGGHGDIYTGLRLVYPEIFYALLLMKLPVIAGDAGNIALLARRSLRAARVYALSPYMIVITSLWGNFDPLVGFFLLASCVAFGRSKLASGFLYGLSLMKIYTVVAAGAYLAHLRGRPGDLVRFLAGVLAALSPTIYYLAVDPEGLLYVLFFQATRPVNGVNVYYSLVEVRSLEQVTQLTRLVSLVFAASIIVVTVKLARRGAPLHEFVTSTMLAYVVFAPVTNEQLLAAVVPVGLLSRGFSHKLTVFPLLYIAFNSTYHYFAIPIAYSADQLRAAWESLNEAWGLLVKDYQLQIRYLIGASMGFASFWLLTSYVAGDGERVRLRVSWAGRAG